MQLSEVHAAGSVKDLNTDFFVPIKGKYRREKTP